MRGILARSGAAVLLAVVLSTSGCSWLGSTYDNLFAGGPPAGQAGHVSGFLGGVVADEPQAALLARQVLSAGGDAADAATVLGFTLAVTLPSRAGLGGGGACLSYTTGGSGNGAPEAVLFTSLPPANAGGSDRPAAVPMLARGLYLLHARYGRMQFETLLLPVEQLARGGFPASRAFVRDLAVAAGPLAADPGAAAVFFRNGEPLPEGALMAQPDLAATLAQLRTAGVGDLYQGGLARRLVAAAAQAGATLSLNDLRGALPRTAPPIGISARDGDIVAFLPPPADGGLAAAAAFEVLDADPAAIDRANARAIATAARWRQGGIDVKTLLTADPPPGSLPPLPASTTFATFDKDGNAVVCALTMGNLFGTGRIAPGTGILLAASPSWLPPPLLSAAIAYNPDRAAFRALAGGSGQAGAPLAVAIAINQALRDRGATAKPVPTAVPDPGRVNIISCSRYLPKDDSSCAMVTDPRGFGLAGGSS
jgi:gamma-glutamyltranspeptidase/glutathione hydrolase